jgi:hypothetical protein
MGHRQDDNGKEDSKYCEGNLTKSHFFQHRSHMTALGLNHIDQLVV